MPRPVPEGFKRPERVNVADTPIEEKTTLRQALKNIPAHYVESIRSNESLRDCCRDIDNLSYQRFKTQPQLEGPDLAMIECAVCGAKHRRTLAGSGGVN